MGKTAHLALASSWQTSRSNQNIDKYFPEHSTFTHLYKYNLYAKFAIKYLLQSCSQMLDCFIECVDYNIYRKSLNIQLIFMQKFSKLYAIVSNIFMIAFQYKT